MRGAYADGYHVADVISTCSGMVSLGGGLVRSIVITGVSTGIGYGAAREFARHGYRVVGSVRKREDAERLARELGSGFVPLVFT
jgi:NADP-dependent 3-hydroxy acid dehydrogenase YdfG